MTEDVKQYRPDASLWIMGLSWSFLNMGTLLWVSALGRPVFWFILANAIAAGIAIKIVFSCGGLAKFRERRRLLNRIGYQRIWMLTGTGVITTRIERRDHQNVVLNTSRYALYEKLGGQGPKFRIVRNDDAPYGIELDWFKVHALDECMAGDYVQISGIGFTMWIRLIELLESLSATNAAPPVAIGYLLGAIRDKARLVSILELEKHTEHRDEVERLRRDRDSSRVAALWALSVLHHVIERIDKSSRLKQTKEAQAIRAYVYTHITWCKNFAPEHIAHQALPHEFIPKDGYPVG